MALIIIKPNALFSTLIDICTNGFYFAGLRLAAADPTDGEF